MRTLADVHSETLEKEALLAAKELLTNSFPVEQVILFGSKARGDADAESDIDLLLLASRPIQWQERHAIVSALFDLGMKYDVIFSIVVVPSKDWATGPHSVLPIREEVEREGVLL